MQHLKTLAAAAVMALAAGTSYAQDTEAVPSTWGDIEYEGRPWVENISVPFKTTRGLHNRHISLWASHGRYYDVKKGGWKWQRPSMFCTTEDLFTQTIVIPYLIPMLENSGACVFTPRERDWQRNEVIVDNDDSNPGTSYIEVNTKEIWTDAAVRGFAQHEGMYLDRENPFAAGTTRMCLATKKAKKASLVSYQPIIPEAGRYAVYVSYVTLENSADDVIYTVWHKGQQTEIKVNQRMGGGTWVYIGSYDFDEGNSEYNRVTVSNLSSRKKAVVTTDAVRFGGGMGNIARLPMEGVYLPQDTTASGSQLPPSPLVSGLPRCLEGARYYTQWAGMPYAEVTSSRLGTDDYADDINSRSFMTNYVGGGSCYMPNQQGLKVPIELSLGVHSDAGYGPCDSIVGTLTICTTDFNDGLLDAGISRQASKNFAQRLLDEIPDDLARKYGKWNRRELYDRNYSESRVPAVPSAILEMMSHQNFNDMRYGHDPNFKFSMARAIYKTILRYVSDMHDKEYTVTPLAPDHFAISLDDDEATLTWQEVTDDSERTATPTGYVVYTKAGNADFDNGTLVQGTKMKIKLAPGVLYSFRVAAVNKGGRSFPTEVLSASYTPGAKATVMIVNAFNRLASPAVTMDGSGWKFDIDKDPGVSYGKTAGFLGYQLDCDPLTAGKEGPGGLGYSDTSLMGQFIAGNDFNYVATHARALHSAGLYNIVSCSDEALMSGHASLSHCQMADVIFGLERNDGYSIMKYEVMRPALRKALEAFTRRGGALLVSGAYVASDMLANNRDTETRLFLNNVLRCHLTGTYSGQNDVVSGLGTSMQYYNHLNEQHYAATRTDILSPLAPAFATMLYGNGNAACVAYKGADYRAITMGFPFECIKGDKKQGIVMRALARFLLGEKE